MNLSTATKAIRLSSAVTAATTTTITSSALDTKGFDGALFIVSMGAIAPTSACSAKLQQSSDDGVLSDQPVYRARSFFGLRWREAEKEAAKERQGTRNDIKEPSGNVSGTSGDSRDHAGARVGVSGKSIDKAASIAEHRPDLVDKVTRSLTHEELPDG